MSLEPRRMRIRWPFGILLADLPFPPRMPGCLDAVLHISFVCYPSASVVWPTSVLLPRSPTHYPPESYPLRGVYYEHWRKSPSSKPYLSWEKSIKRSQAAMAHACYFHPDDPAFLIMKLLPGDWNLFMLIYVCTGHCRGSGGGSGPGPGGGGSRMVPRLCRLQHTFPHFCSCNVAGFLLGFFCWFPFFLGVPPTKSADIPYI